MGYILGRIVGAIFDSFIHSLGTGSDIPGHIFYSEFKWGPFETNWEFGLTVPSEGTYSSSYG